MSASHPTPPPPPPPLPPQRYGRRAATAIARLAQPFFYASRPPSAQGHRENDALSRLTRHRPSAVRNSSPPSSRSASHKTGIPIVALDISPSGSHAVLAGREILKTVCVESGSATEDVNIRTKITAYAAAHSSSRLAASARHRDQLAVTDVRWSNGSYASVIATAAAGGRIVLYDLTRTGLELNTLHEHARQVHKLAFSPFKGELLLSGSQDGSVKLWDLRALPGSNRRGNSQITFAGHDQGIRDVKWSTGDGVEFATATDNGVVQRWDIRRSNAPLLRISAHEKTCTTVDWHPGGRYLVSGGADKLIKVWDCTRTDRRQTPCWTIQAPQALHNVCWRPATALPAFDFGDEMITDIAEDGARKLAACVAASYDRDPRIHIWDFRRPNLPFQEIDRYEHPSSALLWRNSELLWSVGEGGVFAQTDLNFAGKPLDRLNANVLAVAPGGVMAFFSDKNDRIMRRMSVDDAASDFLRQKSHSSNERLSGSNGGNDNATGSFDEGGAGLIMSDLRTRRMKKAMTMRVSASVNTLPEARRLLDEHLPSVSRSSMETARPVLDLDSVFETTQVGAWGRVGGVFDAEAFKFLANNYEDPASVVPGSHDIDAPRRVEVAFNSNSRQAARVGDHELAHTWRILAYTVRKELEDKANEPIVTKTDTVKHPHYSVAHALLAKSGTSTTTLSIDESHSQMTTPRAGPADISHLPVFDKKDFGINKSIISTKSDRSGIEEGHGSLDEISSSSEDWTSKAPILEEPNEPNATVIGGEPYKTTGKPINIASNVFSPSGQLLSPKVDSPITNSMLDLQLEQQLVERRAALKNYRARPRTLVQLNDNFSSGSPKAGRGVAMPPKLERYDSNESLQMLSESNGSRARSFLTGSFEESFGSEPGFEDSSVLRADRSDMKLSPRKTISAIDQTGISSYWDAEEDLLEQLRQPREPRHAVQEDEKENPPLPMPVVMQPRTFKPGPRVAKSITRSTSSLTPQKHSEDIEAEPMNPEAAKTGITSITGSHPVITSGTVPSKPWHASPLIPSLFAYHLDTLSSPQMPAMLAVYLAPYYPHLFPSTSTKGRNSMGAHSFISPARLNFILLSYHAQLVSMRLFTAAASFRKACGTVFPNVSERASLGKAGGWWCRVCRKNIRLPKEQIQDANGAGRSSTAKLRAWGLCVRCQTKAARCMVCQQDVPLAHLTSTSSSTIASKGDSSSRFLSPGTSSHSSHGTEQRMPSRRKATALWTYCQFCGHGGHAGCLRSWFSHSTSSTPNTAMDSNLGMCAVPGCLHDCTSGSRRDEVRSRILHQRKEREQLRKGSGVLRDEKVVRESAAVGQARGLGLVTGIGGVGGLPSRAATTDLGEVDLASPGGSNGSGRGRGRWRRGRGGRGGGSRDTSFTGGVSGLGIASDRSPRPSDVASQLMDEDFGDPGRDDEGAVGESSSLP